MHTECPQVCGDLSACTPRRIRFGLESWSPGMGPIIGSSWLDLAENGWGHRIHTKHAGEHSLRTALYSKIREILTRQGSK